MKLKEIVLSTGVLMATPEYSFINCNFEFSDKLLAEEIIKHYNKKESPKHFEEFLEHLDELDKKDNYISRRDFDKVREKRPLKEFPYLYKSFTLLKIIE